MDLLPEPDQGIDNVVVAHPARIAHDVTAASTDVLGQQVQAVLDRHKGLRVSIEEMHVLVDAGIVAMVVGLVDGTYVPENASQAVQVLKALTAYSKDLALAEDFHDIAQTDDPKVRKDKLAELKAKAQAARQAR